MAIKGEKVEIVSTSTANKSLNPTFVDYIRSMIVSSKYMYYDKMVGLIELSYSETFNINSLWLTVTVLACYLLQLTSLTGAVVYHEFIIRVHYFWCSILDIIWRVSCVSV